MSDASIGSPGAANALLPFIGYYALSGDGLAPGAFLAIGGVEQYAPGAAGPSLAITISASFDGTMSSTYADFDVTPSSGGTVTLTVGQAGAPVLVLTLARTAADGLTGTCSGQAWLPDGTQPVDITGTTRFNPVPLTRFRGRYLQAGALMLEIAVVAGQPVITYAGPGTSAPTRIDVFAYVPDMYVLFFAEPSDPTAKVEIMLGTAGVQGLAAGITLPDGVVYGFTATPQPAHAPVAPVMQAHLREVLATVNAITDPFTGGPLQIPDFATLYQAAGHLDAAPDAAERAWTINTLLGRASSVGSNAPTESYALSFPNDHHLHADMGLEWYWIGAHVNVIAANGETGRLALLLSMEKARAVGLKAQQEAGWSALDATLVTNLVTVTVDMGPGRRSIHRRRPNVQWPAMGGAASFSQPGDAAFHYACGNDSLSGPLDVLPLSVRVDDGDHMRVDIVLKPNDAIEVDRAFFLQGVPKTDGIAAGGTGFTPVPTPGLYYSWPQLQVGGTITVDGMVYTIVSGTGWIDHELMMTSLENPKGAVHPVPFVEDPIPYNGWVWQYYHLANGQAFTGAGFVLGAMTDHPTMSYGYYLVPKDGGWQAIFINGQIDLLYPNAFPARIGTSGSAMVDIPIMRAYHGVENMLLGKPLSGVASPWFSDGTFDGPNGAVCAEIPADYTDQTGLYANGVGFMESVGFEPVASYRTYALGRLKS